MKNEGGSLKRFFETSRLVALIQSLTLGIFEGIALDVPKLDVVGSIPVVGSKGLTSFGF
jgi:hypothetical protein